MDEPKTEQFLMLKRKWIERELKYFTPAMLMVWIVLKTHENIHTHLCFPSKNTIAKMTGLSVSTVKRALASLEGSFVIEIYQEYSNTGVYHNVYKMKK